MADLAASPALCHLVQNDPVQALCSYTLSSREQKRLAAVACQPGMAVNCTIHRATRMIPLDTMLPFTCAALGFCLGREVDAYWAVANRPAIRFDVEAARFVAHLQMRLTDPDIAWPWPAPTLFDVVRLEFAIETLRVTSRITREALPSTVPVSHRLHPTTRVVKLDHEPGALLAGMRRDPPELAKIPALASFVVLTSRAGELDMFAVPPDRASDLEALTTSGIAAKWLIEAGLAVPH